MNITEIFEKNFDLSGDTIIFPIRHHSPACAVHAAKTAEIYKPDIILIEGSSDADHLIPYLRGCGVKTPFCFYTVYYTGE